MSEVSFETQRPPERTQDPGELFDHEVRRLNEDYRRRPSDFFNTFLKLLPHSSFERLAELTLHGGPKNEDDEDFIDRCREVFASQVELGKIKVD
jgi:hypothetical protein